MHFEWYWIILIIAGFCGLAYLFVYLGSVGAINREGMKLLLGISGGASAIANTVADSTDTPVIDIFALLMSIVNKAVLAAENAFYNNEIKPEERHEVCMERLKEMLTAIGIELDEQYLGIIDTLIAAACEEIGHGNVAAKEAEEKEVGFN